MPKWLESLIPYARGAGTGAAGLLGAKAVLQMTGADIPAWGLLLIAVALGVSSVFFEQLAKWLWDLYQNKKLKYFVGIVLFVVLIAWVGWPWQRMQNLFAEITPKQQVISEKWMSETEAEQFIIKKLQGSNNRDNPEIFERRIRFLLKWQLSARNTGRFKCESDSTWREFNITPVRAVLALGGYHGTIRLNEYDGTIRLSEYMGLCEIQYATDHIYRTDWVKQDNKLGRIPLTPE